MFYNTSKNNGLIYVVLARTNEKLRFSENGRLTKTTTGLYEALSQHNLLLFLCVGLYDFSKPIFRRNAMKR